MNIAVPLLWLMAGVPFFWSEDETPTWLILAWLAFISVWAWTR
jgi:hypothetical protein